MLLKSFKSVVLLQEVIHGLNIVSDGVYVDGTFGQGGHSRKILSLLNQKGRLLAIDRDHASVEIGEHIAKHDARFTIIHGKFSGLFKYIRRYDLFGKVNGILLDLGLSRLQLENPDRGFSFVGNGRLDMRMDTSSGLSADMWLRKASLEKIIWVLKNYGEEKFSRRIAKSIIMYRDKSELKYTYELVRLIIDSIPWCDRYKHPATRTFQAIRIYINNELKEIQMVLQDALSVLAPGGRLLVISFHSLEDRIVKNFFLRHKAPLSLISEVGILKKRYKYFHNVQNVFCLKNIKSGHYENMNVSRCKFYLKSIDRAFPSKEEIKDNVSVRSAVLRCVEKVIM